MPVRAALRRSPVTVRRTWLRSRAGGPATTAVDPSRQRAPRCCRRFRSPKRPPPPSESGLPCRTRDGRRGRPLSDDPNHQAKEAIAMPNALPIMTLGSRATGPEPFHHKRGEQRRSGAARANCLNRNGSQARACIHARSWLLRHAAVWSSHPTQQAAGCSQGCECPRWSAQDIDSAQVCASLSCREKSAAEARPSLSLGRALKSARIQGTKRARAAWACSLRRRSTYPFSNRGRFSGARPLARRHDLGGRPAPGLALT